MNIFKNWFDTFLRSRRVAGLFGRRRMPEAADLRDGSATLPAGYTQQLTELALATPQQAPRWLS